MNKEEIVRMAREAGLEAYSILPHKEIDWDCLVDDLATFAALVAAAKEREMQARVAILHAMYEQACQHRDQLMDERSVAIAAMRGKIQ